MDKDVKLRYLKIALIILGIFFIVGVYPLVEWYKIGWQWTPPQDDYEQMIVGIYATMGVFYILASRDPTKYLSFIWFSVWANIVHATIMLYQSIIDLNNIAHLWGDVPALYIAAFIIAWLTPKGNDQVA